MEQAASTEQLKKYLERIDGIFALDDMADQDITSDFITAYYEKSNFGYKFFHSKKDAVHMALNYNGVFNEEGYYEQVRIIEDFIKREGNIKKVLELGCGKGFNTICLAANNSTISFQGLDLTPDFIENANKKSKSLPNVNFKLGDFSDLPIDDSLIDLVFEVEATCHAKDMKKVLSEACRVLKPGGHFILFDGYRQPNFDQLDPMLIKASKLVEVSMAVEQGYEIDKWINMAKDAGFEIIVSDDISYSILPNLFKFQRLAKKFFKRKWIAKLILRMLPAHLVKNSVAGLLMPFTMAGNAQGYYKIIIKN